MLKKIVFQSILPVVKLICLAIALSCNPSNAEKSNTSFGKLKKAEFKSKSPYLNKMSKALLQTPSGDVINTYLAINSEEQTKGLSGTKPKHFTKREAMLFFGERDQVRSFWMPDTYFDLDIFFLDKDFKVLAVERNAPKHPGRENPHKIYKTKHYVCRHVLELKSSKFSAKIVPGTKLIWTSSPDHSQIGSKTHLSQ